MQKITLFNMNMASNLLYAMKLAKFPGMRVEDVFECKSTEQMSDEGYNSNGE